MEKGFDNIGFINMNNTCFNIFPFGHEDEYRNLFENVIYPLVQTHTGLICQDATDYYESVNVKMALISQMIENSNLIIVDISEKNPNVFFEFGIAYQLKKPIIILCKKENWESEKVWEKQQPFDIGGREFLFYENDEDLRVQLGQYIYDAIYKTNDLILNWHVKTNDPSYTKSPNEIILFPGGQAWSYEAINDYFFIRYDVNILEPPVKDNPDIRFFISPLSNIPEDSVRPKIMTIYPWEMDVNQCHIDFARAINITDADRLQQVSVTERDNLIVSGNFSFKLLISFNWPNYVVEGDFFKKENPRLYVPINRLIDEGFPLHKPRYIGFTSNCKATIKIIKLKSIYKK